MIQTNNTSIMRGAWAITTAGLVHTMATISVAHKQADSWFDLMFTKRFDAYKDQAGIGHVNIKGALVDNAPKIYQLMGCTDYRTIRADIDAMVKSGARAIMFHIDSPGGTVAGIKECAAAIKECGLPTLAYCDGLACSAAYYLAATCDDIASSPSSEVGNIGTVLQWDDYTKMWEAFGVESYLMVSEGADLKGTFRESPLTDAQRTFLQESVNEAGEDFRNHVTSNRPDIDPEVFRAGWYEDERALELGLVDAVTTENEAYTALLAEVSGLKSYQ